MGHRISGVLLFLLTPFLIYWLELSLSGEVGFTEALEIADCLTVRLLLVVVAWMFLHHLFTGIRFLIMEFDVWMDKEQATRSAWGVVVADLVALLILLGVML